MLQTIIEKDQFRNIIVNLPDILVITYVDEPSNFVYILAEYLMDIGLDI